MDGQIVLAALVVVVVVGVITWLAISARQPRVRMWLRYVLLTAAIASTTLLIAMVALFVVLVRCCADSPAGAVPLLLAIPCAFFAVLSWIAFVVQARLKVCAPP